MSVVVSDLVARIHAEGVEETTTAVKGAGASAEQTAKAFEIMAEKAAKIGGGTATQWLESFARSGAQPTAAALAEAAAAADKANTAIERTAATAKASAASITAALSGAGVDPSGARVQSILAAQNRADQQGGLAKALEQAGVAASVARQQAKSLTEETKAAATEATNVEKGFRLSESSALRFGAGIVGVGLGLNLAAGAANLLHDTIAKIVDGQTQWERSLVQVHSLYGDLAPSIVAISQAQTNAPGAISSQQEFLSANLNAAYLSSRYGLGRSSITGLTSAADRFSGVYGYSPEERADLQARALGFAEGGGTGLRSITGTEGDPLSIARRIGGVSGAQLSALTPQQLRDVQATIGTLDLEKAAQAGAANQGGLLAAQAAAQRALSQAQGALQNRLEGAPADDTRLRALIQSQAPRNALEAQQQQDQLAELDQRAEAFSKSVDDAQQAFDAASKAVTDNATAIEQNTKKLEQLGVSLGGATFRLLGFGGNPEDRYSIARGDVGAQAQAAVAARAVTAQPPRAQAIGEIEATATNRAYQEAYQTFVAGQAQQAQRQANAIREQLELVTRGGPGADRLEAQRALEEADRRRSGYLTVGQAQRAGDMAGRSATEAQAQLDAIGLRSDERRLVVAEQMAGYRRESLQLEGQISSLALRQADLGDRMAVASRENLNTVREVIRAQQAALPANFAVRDIDYQQQQLELRAQQSRVSVIRGGGPTEDLADLRRQYRELELNSVDAQRAALEGNRGVELAQRTQTTEGLERGLKLTDLEEQRRALEDQLIPLEQAARYTAERQRTVERTLELLDIEDTKARTAAQQQLNSANQLKLVTDEIARQAEDYAAGLNLGATAADRAQAALEKARDFLKETIPLLHTLTTTDVDARIANGLGAGGLGPSPGAGGVNIVIHPNAQTPQQFKDDVHQAVEDALNRFFAGAATAAPGAPSTVGGAGR